MTALLIITGAAAVFALGAWWADHWDETLVRVVERRWKR